MTDTPLLDAEREIPELQGHSIGFIDTQTQCDIVIRQLNAAGIPDSAITVFCGELGTQLFKRMMQGQLWGEAAEDLLAQGTLELRHGHLGLAIELHDRGQAAQVADVATRLGGHGFYYFGELIDERLTR